MRKCKCGNDVASNAKACPKCGHRFTGAFTKFVAWIFAAFFGLILLVVIIDSHFDTPSAAPPTPNASTAAPAVQTSMLTPAEKIYFGAALSYLKTANSQGTKLATTMAGASDGSSTLGDIKAA